MDDLPAQYPKWAAPADDGQVLVWPAVPTLLAEARRTNASLRHATTRIQNVPLGEVRRAMRQCLGHPDDDQLALATGHQAELYHPGVWAKDIVISLAAKATSGVAYHFAVDTDEPKHLHLRWPGESHLISDDPGLRTARWSGLAKPPSPAHLAFLRRRLAEARAHWTFEPMVGQFLDEMGKLASDTAGPRSLAEAITDACHAVDISLGLGTHMTMAGSRWRCPAYLLFAHHILSRAGEFAAAYNEALAEFRKRNTIRNPGRPMPDLKISADEIETPFWLDSLADGGRRRGSVRRDGRGLGLDIPGGGAFVFDPETDGWLAAQRLGDFLRGHNLRLSPRALTLTMCLRLLAMDQFVHGIGGGQYDQVTDRIIERHFGLGRPGFAVATATLLFPEAAGRQRVCLRCLRHEGHRLHHAVLGDAKDALVRRIEAAPRQSVRRRELFAELHQRLRESQGDPRLLAWEHSYAAALEQDAADGQIFDRELFYLLQPRQRLEMLIDTLGGMFGSASR